MSTHSRTAKTGRILFPGPGIVVTSTHVETFEGCYRIRDLVIENPCYYYAFPTKVMAIYCGAVEMLASILPAALSGSPVLFGAAGLLAGAGLTGAILIDHHRKPRWMTLTARCRGRRIVLFSSRDRRVFEQVRRAVVRAQEASRRPKP
ncbi:DUF6232 family protein [Actinoplanes sp. NPDC020271]|uniref:DUF6232 family protein n=1 Tax=Actinoplanes sp. NPDC020271 TaxID=3363896 RepID=UPI0037AD9546